MNFMKPLTLLGCLACIALVLALAQAQAPTTTQQENNGNSNGRSTAPNGGILNLLLTPLTSTLRRARQFLGHRLENVNDGMDQVRLRTYQMFMSLYNKTYSPEEIPKRMALFFQRRKEIERSVRAFAEGKMPFRMKENEFIDWDEGELKKLTGVSRPSEYNLTQEELGSEESDDRPRVGNVNPITGEDDTDHFIVKADTIPASKDWRQSGCISTPINQLKCGACYAIATMSVVESMRCIKGSNGSPILSPQQIVDCASSRAGYSNYGCDGGWPTEVLKYLQRVGVAARETCYPFVRRQNYCRLSQVKSGAGCTVSSSPTDTRLNYKVVNNERDILYHVANTGPVVTVMQATDKFLYYGSGIFDDPICRRRLTDVDHAIVIVGYGRENGVDYWIIKNSWGTTTWGENGYGKYKRGTNACSIGLRGWVLTS